MKNFAQRWFAPSNDKTVTHTFQVGLIRIVSDTIVSTFLIYLAFQTNAWQFAWIAGAGVTMIIVGLLGLWFIRHERPQLGIWLIIADIWPTLLLSITLIAGLGLPLGIIFLSLTLLIAGQTLPQRQVNWAAVMAIIGSVLIITLDRKMNLGYRLSTPDQFWWVVMVMTGVMILIYSYFTIRDFSNFSLRTKLVIAFLVVISASLGSLAFINARSTREILVDRTNQLLLAAASQTAASVDTFIKTNLDAVETEAQLPVIVRYLSLPAEQRDQSSPEAIDALKALLALNHKDPVHISSYALLDTSGRNLLDSLTPDIGLDESDGDYFQVALETQQPYISSVNFSKTTESPFLYFSHVVRNPEGNPVGVLRLRYSAIVLQQLVERSRDRLTRSTASAVLLDEYQVRLAVTDNSDLIFQSVAPLDQATMIELQAARRLPNRPVEELSTQLVEFAQGLANAATTPTFAAETHPEHDDRDHVDQVAVGFLRTQPWKVVFSQSPEIYEASIQAQIQRDLEATVFIALAGAIGAFVLGQYLAGPIIRLTSTAQRLATGDLQAQAVVESQDETGQLAETFNQMTTQLRSLIGSLEDQIQARTAELVLSMEVGQRAAAIRELGELLPTITEFIRQQFDLYYTQVYFVDDINQNLVLQAGTGEVGRELLARHHSLPIGSGSMVGLAAAEGEAILVPDTLESNLHKPNPLLPKTRSELAVPLIAEGQVIGVLDMQAIQPHTFTASNQTVFEAMATQLAISIDSARQWTLAQEAQQRSEEALSQLTRETWAEVLSTQSKNLGFSYDLSAVKPMTSNTQNGGVVVPVVVQNQAIGHLSVHPPEGKVLSEDEQAFLAAVTQQLAQKAENIRLFEETQQRATREQIARQIADKIRASRDIETALKTAAAELSKALGTAKAAVNLHIADKGE